MGGKLDAVSATGRRLHVLVHHPATSRRRHRRRREQYVFPDDLKVLAVDDNATNRAIIKGHLRAVGADVVTAPTAQRALDALQQAAADGDPFDLVLLDGTCPGWTASSWRAGSPRTRRCRPRA